MGFEGSLAHAYGLNGESEKPCKRVRTRGKRRIAHFRTRNNLAIRNAARIYLKMAQHAHIPYLGGSLPDSFKIIALKAQRGGLMKVFRRTKPLRRRDYTTVTYYGYFKLPTFFNYRRIVTEWFRDRTGQKLTAKLRHEVLRTYFNTRRLDIKRHFSFLSIKHKYIYTYRNSSRTLIEFLATMTAINRKLCWGRKAKIKQIFLKPVRLINKRRTV